MRSAAEIRVAAEAEVRDALAVLSEYAPHAELPGVDLLDERITLSGKGFVPRSAFRILLAADGWLGLSLPRPSDRDLVPALVELDADTTDAEACWAAVAAWLADRSVAVAEARAITLGLAAARIPDETRAEQTRPAVLVTSGAGRAAAGEPRVVDLSALWAGPLAARLLGLAGARVTKVESTSRPDGARYGSSAFYACLHPADHRSLVVDFSEPAGVDKLRELVLAADVVIEGSRPRALRQLGIHAEQAVARGAVWCSITAYGREGDSGMRVGFGDDVAAGAGLVADTDVGPVPVGDALADPLTGAVAAAAVVETLATGRGALLDVSMHDVCARVAARSHDADRRRRFT